MSYADIEAKIAAYESYYKAFANTDTLAKPAETLTMEHLAKAYESLSEGVSSKMLNRANPYDPEPEAPVRPASWHISAMWVYKHRKLPKYNKEWQEWRQRNIVPRELKDPPKMPNHAGSVYVDTKYEPYPYQLVNTPFTKATPIILEGTVQP